MYKIPRILPAGDKAVVVEYGNEISEECNKRVLNLYSALKRQDVTGITSNFMTLTGKNPFYWKPAIT